MPRYFTDENISYAALQIRASSSCVTLPPALTKPGCCAQVVQRGGQASILSYRFDDNMCVFCVFFIPFIAWARHQSSSPVTAGTSTASSSSSEAGATSRGHTKGKVTLSRSASCFFCFFTHLPPAVLVFFLRPLSFLPRKVLNRPLLCASTYNRYIGIK